MFRQSKTLGLAVVFLYVTAALLILAPSVGGLTAEAVTLIPFGVLCLAIGIGLSRGWRWLAWLTFLGTLFGGIFALGQALSATQGPEWWYFLMMVTSWLCAMMLFLYLWKSKSIEAST